MAFESRPSSSDYSEAGDGQLSGMSPFTSRQIRCPFLIYRAKYCPLPQNDAIIHEISFLLHVSHGQLLASCEIWFINHVPDRNCTALHYAAKYNNPDVAEALLGYGANINSTLKSSTALLVTAAFASETVIPGSGQEGY